MSGASEARAGARAPGLFAEGRGRRFVRVALLGVGQAAAAAGLAFATRSLFLRWHDGLDPAPAAAGLAVAGAALAALGLAERLAAEDLGQRYAAAVRRAVFARLSSMEIAALEARRAGGLALRFTGDLAALSGWASRGAARIVSAGAALPLTLAALIWISPAAAAGAAAPLALGAAATALAGLGLARRHRALRRRRARLAARMAERVRLAPLLRLAGRSGRETAALAAEGDGLRRAALSRARRRAALRAIPDLAGATAAAGAALACWRAGAAPAELAGALAALALAIGHARALAAAWDARCAAEAARTRLDALLAGAPPRRRCERMREGCAALRFDDVAVGPLAGFDGKLRRGAKAALTGPSGAGKSALLRLAAGLAAPAQGRVRVGGADPMALSSADRARAILFLGAETPILAGSFRRALAFGADAKPDDAALEALARAVGLGPALDRLGGLDGALAEGGRNLSEGERARVGLARLARAPEALALIDGLDAHLDAPGRATLARLLADRPGAALCVFRDPVLAESLTLRWRIGPAAPQDQDGGAPPSIATSEPSRRAVWKQERRPV
ncbi:MAG: ATP-binding cassette domain-containing protein [Rubrimonas sp.]